MQRVIEFSPNEYYHIYNRGVDKRTIFLDSCDKDRFQAMLFLCNSSNPVIFRDVQGLPFALVKRGVPIVAIGAYCLMDNHFHILLKEIEEGGISKFMSKLTTAYSMYFNKKHARTGALFENNFKAKHLNTDEYLKYIFSYIHLNPLKLIEPRWKEDGIKDSNKAKGYLSTYNYSSYLDYMGHNRPNEKRLLSLKEFPEYFSEENSFENYLDDWISFKDEELKIV
jgi:REP element-mobilizing transposase RayT